MAIIIPGSFHRSTALRVISVLFVLAVVVPDAGGRHQHHRHDCLPFTCGRLSNVSSPFRRRGDPSGCGFTSYELTCTDDKATIQIYEGTYSVTGINYSDSTFWVVDANISDSPNTLPQRIVPPYPTTTLNTGCHTIHIELEPASSRWSAFVNCSQEINNNEKYRPVACLNNTSRSFVYVLIGSIYSCYIDNLEPSCGHLAITPLHGNDTRVLEENPSCEDVVKIMRGGFAVRFPYTIDAAYSFKECRAETFRHFREEPASSAGIKYTMADTATFDIRYMACVIRVARLPAAVKLFVLLTIIAMWLLKWIAGKEIVYICTLAAFTNEICSGPTKSNSRYRYFTYSGWGGGGAPLVVMTFLAHKCWKKRITIDAVDKFLRMQLMLGPTRYAYTDITAITGHFRDEKLGQGGYGSVYKGVLLPGNIHVAVKILANYSCDGEEFINEVSTIGSIHHVNVVSLVGFCAEETRRALVYEYMPNGSLEKYIFSPEKSFSWEKLNEIALGIARGINYLHRGCEMQILHFDIKPHNILLDSKFIPKVADFGLAKLYPQDNSFVPVSAARGTIGYIAPEMISWSFGVISSKSDVYSFGMLLLEMVGGRRNSKQDMSSSSQAYYPSWVYNQLAQQELGEVVTSAFNMHELEKKLCIVGLHCIQMNSYDRPTMSEVIEMLEGDVDGLRLPSRPFFCDDEPMPHLVDVGFDRIDLAQSGTIN
ncbi:LOW QUALITY PROTEIN: LEAF RUST 10 DISEASE-RESISTANCEUS RECEPTOR-LIKE PROTEIN KINASE-like 2.4 [Oryza sativa Japonica Group]